MKKFLALVILCISISETYAQSSRTSSELGSNIFSVSPIQIMALNLRDDDADAAVNFSYERIFSNEYFGIKLPITFYLQSPYYAFMPTLKIYPFGQGVVKYAFGPQFYFATGEYEHEDVWYGYPNYTHTSISRDRTQVGFMINNSLNFTIMQNLYLGFETALGINYFDDNANDADLQDEFSYSRVNSQFYPAFQLNFSMGYRF